MYDKFADLRAKARVLYIYINISNRIQMSYHK